MPICETFSPRALHEWLLEETHAFSYRLAYIDLWREGTARVETDAGEIVRITALDSGAYRVEDYPASE